MKSLYRTILLVLLALVVILQAINILAPHRKSFVVCPVDAISMEGGKAIIDSSKCIGCRRCVDGFPFVPARPVEVEAKNYETAIDSIPEVYKTPVSTPELKSSAKAVTEHKTSETKSFKKAYKVDPATCIGCGLCEAACPTGAIKMVDGKAIIDKDLCINCGICKNGNNGDFKGCPVDAISAP